jgi:multiple sugar transport system ATP-binding protein
MALTLRARRWSKQRIESKIQEISKILRIERFLNTRVTHLSGGEQQRVAIGRAIVREPDIFLLDEPLSNLDAKLRMGLRIELLELHKKLNTTSLYVTHDQTEALSMGEKILVLNNGLMQQYGTPEEIYYEPANKFVASFVGNPEMNFFRGVISLNANEVVIKLASMNLSFTKSSITDIDKIENNQRVILGIRPENLFLSSKSSQNTIPGKVDFQQSIGTDNYIFIYTEVGRIALKIKDDIPLIGSKVLVGFGNSKIYIFDADDLNNKILSALIIN